MGKKENPRRIMSWPLFQIFGDELARDNLEYLEFINIWCVCILYFWSSVRPSAILPATYKPTDTATTLKWSDIRVENENCYVILLRTPKTAEFGKDDCIDLIKFPDPAYCPIRYLNKLLLYNRSFRKVDSQDFVFRQKNDKPLCQRHVNDVLRRILSPLYPGSAFTIYSFRAGMVNELAARADTFTFEQIRAMGKWLSNSMYAYMRTSGRQRNKAMEKFQNILFSEVFF